MKHKHSNDDALILHAGEGRVYNCGPMTAVFKADENETDENYSVSEWWLAPHSDGPGAHLHEENTEVFYVLEGTVSILIGDQWIDAAKGSFIRIPAKTLHDFKNNTDDRAGLLNFFIPGGFERNMPSIVQWFADNK
jgi:mannose-6-phosphate isomerase-like protein (cupin superfamily)